MQGTEKKPDGTPVTAVDREIELFLREEIKSNFPEDGIIGEEFPPHQPEAENQWIIDPIDGTRALIAGVPTFTTLIALLKNGHPQFSMMLQPVTGETWFGDNETTHYNGEATHCQKVETLAAAIFSTTSPQLFRDADKPIIDSIMQNARNCQLGEDGYAYGKLAKGDLHLVVESGLKPYDFLPLVPIVIGAGAIMTDWQGNPLTLESNGDVIAASSKALHKQALALLNPHDR
ncbi:MAG: inositol monophosphatase family protein [Rickettsiales bacterium]|nr:inositol monophosphatase family protein [Rickettsiales bacterium]